MPLKETRLDNNWSIEEACLVFGLDAETLFRYENGTEIPNKWALNIIASVLDESN
ncbi:MAG: helix-turn-helix domain-containing protein [Clostridium sp.]|nr:helix-turn-helix domain-containing protein [Clostridium sp.]MCM1444174.1 helix-turn-helix domain-containing protein [Candidatus Amulumruptor caecigallinarius]